MNEQDKMECALELACEYIDTDMRACPYGAFYDGDPREVRIIERTMRCDSCEVPFDVPACWKRYFLDKVGRS